MGKKEISKIFKLPIGWWKRVPSFQSSQALRPRNRRSGPRRRGNTWVGSIASSNSHTQVHASRANRWIGDHVIQYFLFTTLSNNLLLHLSQMKLNEINCWRVWIWRAHTSCASGKLPYTDLSSDVCWSCDITKQVTFFLLLQLEHKQSCPRVAECGILQLRHTSTWQFKGHERDQKRDESILSTFCCKQTNWCLKHAK